MIHADTQCCLRRRPHQFLIQALIGSSIGIFASNAIATTYYYVGQPFTSVSYAPDGMNPITGPVPAPYAVTNRVVGYIKTNSRLPANIGLPTNIGSTGLNLITDWQFNDGLLTYEAGNSDLLPTLPDQDPSYGELSGSSVTTDALGNIDGFLFWPWAPKAPHSVGQKVDSLFIAGSSQGTSETILNQGLCAAIEPRLNNFCSFGAGNTPGATTFVNSAQGRWSSFDAFPDSGNATSGSGAVAVANIAANDVMNGLQVVLGSGANATISPKGAWPQGFSLDPATGAVSVQASVPAGSYSMTYQLCDSQSSLACVDALIDVMVKAATIPPEPNSANPVPTLDEWGVIALSSLLAMFGLARSRRRRG